MASAFRRKGPDGKRLPRWSYKYRGADGRWHQGTGTTDKATTLAIAQRLESEAAQVRAGVIEPGERVRREASLGPIAGHVDGYRLELLARGDTVKHAGHTASVLLRLLADASVQSVADLAPDRIQAALGRLKVARSARTANHARGAVRAFARWLEANGRIREAPKGLAAISRFNEKADRKRIRRAITKPELDRLLSAAESGPTVEAFRGPRDRVRVAGSLVFLTGPQRATLYRLAMGTGFRANELRSLTPECFRLDGPEPCIVLDAAVAKNRREAVQPIVRELADGLRGYVSGIAPGRPVVPVPERTASMLRRDLEAAGIPYKDERGRVLDFHALRHSYITHLIASGVNPKIVQTLARHSTITLTLDLYTHVEDEDVRKALEGG